MFEEFPRYDVNRLVELRTHPDERVRHAAEFLLDRDGAANDPHYRLSAKASEHSVSPEEVRTLLDSVEQAGERRNVYQLALTRRRLLRRPAMSEARERLLRLLTQAPRDRARTEALIAAVVGEYREPTLTLRSIALEALSLEVGTNLAVREAVAQVARQDGAARLRGRALEILEQNPETPD